jgi:SAM-dependent methyltransferase
MTNRTSHWNKHAQQWQLIGSPLRPCEADIRQFERLGDEWQRSHASGACTAALLGVTPEIAAMRWPAGTSLLGLDISEPMIRKVWPEERALPSRSAAVCANWLKLPLPDGSIDIAVGDGCFTLLGFPDAYAAVVRSLRRVLRDDGLLAIRFFLRPDRAESTRQVFEDLRAKRIGNFHAFKWRLAMSLHGPLEAGVRLADIWDAWNAEVPSPETLAAELGWPVEVLRTIDAYQGVATRYTFPTLSEAKTVLSEAFDVTQCHYQDYELGERCPILAARPR